MIDAAEVALRFRRFADEECGTYAPRYARLAHAVAEDAFLQEFIRSLPDTQPNLFLAAVQHVTGPAQMPADGAQLRRVVRRHRGEIADLVRTRSTQTNEVGRCASILPALPPGPLALIEVGASAGLCLLLDRFRYEYGEVRLGVPGSSVTLRCAPIGPVPPPIPARFPEIVWRRGLDLEPVDVRDPEARKWLLSLVWSDHPDRRRRLEAALHVAASSGLRVDRGDLVDDLVPTLAQAPPHATLVVFHSAVFPYVAADRREEFVAVLAAHSATRDVVWIANEGRDGIPSLDRLAPHREGRRFRIGRTTFSQGEARTELVALAHPHGHDLEWLSRNPHG